MNQGTREHQDMARRIDVSRQTLFVWDIKPDTPLDEKLRLLVLKDGKLDAQIARLITIKAGVEGEIARLKKESE